MSGFGATGIGMDDEPVVEEATDKAEGFLGDFLASDGNITEEDVADSGPVSEDVFESARTTVNDEYRLAAMPLGEFLRRFAARGVPSPLC